MKVIILGASGYTGAELLRFALVHPEIEIVGLSAETHAGKNMQDVFPHLRGIDLPMLQKIDALDFSEADVVFCALPHGTTQQVILRIRTDYPKIKIIDLSADFRLSDMKAYQHWYGAEHQAQAIQPEAVYGLSEIYRDDIAQSFLIANPGCYPTTIQLPLLPLLQAGFVQPDDIIIDSKSGISGAGRAAKQAMLYCETAESLMAYGVEGHRHSAEMAEQLNQFADMQVQFHFVPHLIPMKRGMLSTIHCKSTKSIAEIRDLLTGYYQNSCFVYILPEGAPPPKTADVLGSNQCRIALYPSAIEGRIMILSVIDNLVKGASGQAMQNFNIACGLPEDTGLQALPLFP